MTFSLPTAQEICEIVADELTLAGGTISDRFEGTERFYIRSRLPLEDTVKPGDFVQGGIAVAGYETEIQVHPYLFRQVCRNGLIMPQLGKTQTIARVGMEASLDELEGVGSKLREAIRTCAQPEVFASATRQFSMTAYVETSSSVFTLLMLSAFSRGSQAALRAEIIERFFRDGDRSLFGLVNAVTSVARDQREPEVRWRLEELGGGMLAMRHPHVKPGPTELYAAATVEQDDLSPEPDFFREEACSAV
jgi:hypothetical protein